MKKIFIAALMMIVLTASVVRAAVETYEGTDEYYVLGAVENINVARERARERALRDAREKAGVYIHSLSRVVNMNMLEDEIISVASGVLRVLDTAYEIIQLKDADGYIIRATVHADIDTGDLEKFLLKDAEEISRIASGEKIIRQQEEQQEQKIETLKQEYRQAVTAEEKEILARQIVDEDKIFLSNLKLREGNKFRDAGDHKRAEKFFSEAIDLNPDNALAWNNRGWSLVEQKKYSQALADFNHAAELYPENEFVFVNRGNVHKDGFSDYDAAIADYNKTIELNPKFSWPYHNRALALGRLKRWDEAIADYEHAIALDQNYASAYNGRAWAYCQVGKFEAALVDANKALTLKPNEANYYDTRACAYEGLKRYEEALTDLNTAIKLSPEGWLFRRRGEIYKLMGDEAKAKADLARAA